MVVKWFRMGMVYLMFFFVMMLKVSVIFDEGLLMVYLSCLFCKIGFGWLVLFVVEFGI